MKTSKVIVLVMAALALSATPALAQRGGGGSRGGGGGSHSSGSVSHSSSSVSHSSSGSRSGSYSSSSSSRSGSYSTPSRSTSSTRSSSHSTSSRSSAAPSTRSSAAPGTRSGVRSEGGVPRSGRPAGVTSGRSGNTGNPGGRPAGVSGARAHGVPAGVRSGNAGTPGGVRGANGASSTGASSGVRTNPEGYARPGHPGGTLPPSHRPIHPAPYFHHPWYGGVVHCHPIFWDPIPPRPWYWPGFWLYCNSYWYDYHVTDVVVVHDYVQQTYNVDMVTYGISGDIMYAIVRDGGSTYLQVYDKEDHLLAEQKINKKYCNMVIDADNGGCWISKKGNKDALLFIWAEGQLLIYEAD